MTIPATLLQGFIGNMTRFESIRHCEPGAHTRTPDRWLTLIH